MFKPKDEHTPVVLDFMKDFECLGTQSLKTVETKHLVKIAPRKIVQELNFLELTVQDVELNVHAVRTG